MDTLGLVPKVGMQISTELTTADITADGNKSYESVCTSTARAIPAKIAVSPKRKQKNTPRENENTLRLFMISTSHGVTARDFECCC